jgi:hypothetical protein
MNINPIIPVMPVVLEYKSADFGENIPVAAPPWWHLAMRINLPAISTEFGPDQPRFVSIPFTDRVTQVQHYFQSIAEPVNGYPKGLFLMTNIPWLIFVNHPDSFAEILTAICDKTSRILSKFHQAGNPGPQVNISGVEMFDTDHEIRCKLVPTIVNGAGHTVFEIRPHIHTLPE